MKRQIEYYLNEIGMIIENNRNEKQINSELYKATAQLDSAELSIDSRVHIAHYLLKKLSREQRMCLCQEIITEQIVKQREKLAHWSTLTAQSGMIDTGYIAQHLVSLCTRIPGQGMRGKGVDLIDGSEVKSANFIDSKDKKGVTEPRWNFSASNDEKLLDFLHYKYIFLVSLDYSPDRNYRIRIWKIDVRTHTALRKRYKEWVNNTERNSRNFQLFPPKSETNSIYAHHGSDKKGQLPPTEIALENVMGAKKIFHAEVIDDNVRIFTFEED